MGWNRPISILYGADGDRESLFTLDFCNSPNNNLLLYFIKNYYFYAFKYLNAIVLIYKIIFRTYILVIVYFLNNLYCTIIN